MRPTSNPSAPAALRVPSVGSHDSGAYLRCGDEDELEAHKIGGGREGVSGDGHQGDNDVGGKHSELQSFLGSISRRLRWSRRYYLSARSPREGGLLVTSWSHRPGFVRHYNDGTRPEM